MAYDHSTIEQKWQRYWSEQKTFKAAIDAKPKYYVLDMFPYPSGSGLHVGHLVGYTATDILARYKRQKGFNVLHPMGWDSFGLAAEQYAVRTGQHPEKTTKANIDNFRRQLCRVGFSYDWDREVATSDPSYYKWTQWIFTLLYNKGLAYEAEMLVNYCPALGTVLANEEVENGRSKEGGHPVERRPLRQWILRITAYAERLIQDLDLIDWPESLKKLQVNWIGKSEGAEVSFLEKNTKRAIKVFTTRPETLFGATFLVLAPEHPLVGEIVTPEQSELVEAYRRMTASKSDLDRTDLNKDKTGVFTGAYAVNPTNGQAIPIWIADYIMMSYGTGAVMAVPAHDERDFAFAEKLGLSIIPVFDPESDSFPEQIPEGMTPSKVREEVLAGKRCWPEEGRCINSANAEISLNGLSVAEAAPKIVAWLEKKGVGKAVTHYKLRDWLFSRQRYWGEPVPILHFADGTKRALEVDELPLSAPPMNDFKPADDGSSPLAKVKEWISITDPKTGKKAERESNTMPQWAGSCWYYLRFCDPHNSEEAWSKEAESYWMAVDMYVGGVEHAVLHLLYARFWHKVLYDCGYVTTPEPFQTLRNQGLVVARAYQKSSGAYVAPDEVDKVGGKYYLKATGEELRSQIEKMSKSKLNGVSPDEVIDKYGADALRLYTMFLGPLEKEKDWNSDAIVGCSRFLNRFYDIVTSDKLSDEASEEALKLGHRLVYGVGQDIEALLFNTAIAKMMEFLNDFSRLPAYPRSVLEMAVQALAPFAPHMAEELWQYLGHEGSISSVPFPSYDAKYLSEAVITYVVQINGKVRARLDLPKDQPEEVVVKAARAHPVLTKFFDDAEPKRVIFVPNKLLNFVL